MTLGEVVSAVAGVAAEDAVRLVRLGELSDIGQVDAYIGAALSSFFATQGPALAAKMASVLEPATKKAVEVIKPSVMEALRDYTPTFAAVAGGMIAVAYLLGNHLGRKQLAGGRRR